MICGEHTASWHVIFYEVPTKRHRNVRANGLVWIMKEHGKRTCWLMDGNYVKWRWRAVGVRKPQWKRRSLGKREHSCKGTRKKKRGSDVSQRNFLHLSFIISFWARAQTRQKSLGHRARRGVFGLVALASLWHLSHQRVCCRLTPAWCTEHIFRSRQFK